MRCSQLSSTSNTRRPAKARMMELSNADPACGATSNVDAIACTAASGSATGASSTNQTPSGNFSAAAAAASIDSRVFPTPPGPTNVTSRCESTSVASRLVSSTRPTNEVGGDGRFPGTAIAAANGRESSARPGPASWNTRLGPCQSAELVLAQAAEAHPSRQIVQHEFFDRQRDEHLAAVGEAHQARRAVDS